MSKPNETPSAPSSDDRNLVSAEKSVVAPDFEENVRQLWEKNRSVILTTAVVVVLAIFGRHTWDWMQQSRVEAQREAYAGVTTDAERLAFAEANAGTQLAGVAKLEVADNAFSEGRFSDAMAGYDAAAEILQGSVLDSRIRLGRAMAQIGHGDSEGGQSGLRDVANDVGATKSVRGEAAYHLASMAAGKGDAKTLAEFATQIMAIDPASPWAQRVALLQAAMLPPSPADAAEISFGTP